MSNKISATVAKTTFFMLLIMCLFVSSCKKTSDDSPSDSTDKKSVSESVDTSADLVPIQIKFPEPLSTGTPPNISAIKNIEPDRTESPLPIYAPVGTTNVALGKSVTSSDQEPIFGELTMVTDGDKQGYEGSYVELGPFLQHITIDLGADHNIYAIAVWHYYKELCVYFDVVVQASSDPDFVKGVKTLFNNDNDNTAGLGTGKDMHYIEKNEGKVIELKGTTARYIRLYSKGNSNNDLNHYVEVEVYGKCVK